MLERFVCRLGQDIEDVVMALPVSYKYLHDE